MYGQIFYHNLMRKYCSMMGTLFNNISIRRTAADNVTVVKTLKVPIAFAPKEEYMRFIREGKIQSGASTATPTDSADIQILLPRMSFELTGYNYAAERQQSVMHELRYTETANEGVKRQYMPVPYDFNFNLDLYTKNIDDGLQVVEQILPYFNPTLNWPVKDLPELDNIISHDIAIAIAGNSIQWVYGGVQPSEDRMLNWTLNFVLRGYLFRPTEQKGLIKTAIVDVFDLNNFGKPEEEQQVVKNVTVAVDPTSAGPSDPHTIVETHTETNSCQMEG